jgi:hypothetical protein
MPVTTWQLSGRRSGQNPSEIFPCCSPKGLSDLPSLAIPIAISLRQSQRCPDHEAAHWVIVPPYPKKVGWNASRGSGSLWGVPVRVRGGASGLVTQQPIPWECNPWETAPCFGSLPGMKADQPDRLYLKTEASLGSSCHGARNLSTCCRRTP